MSTYRQLPGPPQLPLVGNTHQLRPSRMHQILENWADLYGPLYRIKAGHVPMAILSDAPTIRQIFSKRPQRFRRLTKFQSIVADVGVPGLFVAEGDDWAQQRPIFAGALNAVTPSAFNPKIAVSLDRLRDKWKQAITAGEVVDGCRDLQLLVADIAAQLALGVDAGAFASDAELPPLLDLVTAKLVQRLYVPVPYWRVFRLPSDRAMDNALAQFRRQVDALVRETRHRLRAAPVSAPCCYLEVLIAQEMAGECDEHSARAIFNHIGGVLMESYNTLPNAMAWALYYLTRYPALATQMRAEVNAVLGSTEDISGYTEVEQFPFLCAFTDEVTRLKPSITFSGVEPLEDTVILGHSIPKGTVIIALHRYPAVQNENFADGERFDPTRWLPNATHGRCPHKPEAFLRFGVAPRNCPGEGHAMQQVRALLAMVCHNFDSQFAVPESQIVEQQGLTMSPAALPLHLRQPGCN